MLTVEIPPCQESRAESLEECFKRGVNEFVFILPIFIVEFSGIWCEISGHSVFFSHCKFRRTQRTEHATILMALNELKFTGDPSYDATF